LSEQSTIDYSDQNKKKGRAQDIDKHIGERLKEIRKRKGMTQEDLASKLGMTFQQIQKYENGKNRISFSNMVELSRYLGVSLDSFLDSPALVSGLGDKEQNVISQKETDELLKVYYSLEDPKLRKNLLKLVKSMADNMKE